ncbi:metallophosphoesterase [Endozoicomonas lisbonensis]|uniref:Calcineurin-like phosphoesterase domain-containing protein n=1 Tax=Endozoicomonas lisbonensis TaxID=3120522 RepID=A0ABV2SQJ4_9GAMM
MYDIIGDIHGHGTALVELLKKLGYTEKNGVFCHPDRKVIFVGDFIDRGSEHKKALTICRSMVEQGSALAVMGNHEFNAICYATPDPENAGAFLRKHSESNRQAHQAFLDEYPFGSAEHKDIIDWFRTLSLFLDLEAIRVVHAVWHHPSLSIIQPWINVNHCLLSDAYVEASRRGSDLYDAVENLLKGIEFRLPEPYSITDQNGKVRNEVRLKWWDEQATRLPEAATNTGNTELPDVDLPNTIFRYRDSVPLFFGHYWMQGAPEILSPSIACVDYSSKSKNGKLVAYRWQGEQTLNDDHFVWVDRVG